MPLVVEERAATGEDIGWSAFDRFPIHSAIDLDPGHRDTQPVSRGDIVVHEDIAITVIVLVMIYGSEVYSALQV